MATTQHLIPVPGLRRIGLEPAQPPNLHLDCGVWRASCPGCGFELAEGRRQDRVERKAAPPVLPHLPAPNGEVAGPPAPGARRPATVGPARRRPERS
jgi:hypothetical protein